MKSEEKWLLLHTVITSHCLSEEEEEEMENRLQIYTTEYQSSN